MLVFVGGKGEAGGGEWLTGVCVEESDVAIFVAAEDHTLQTAAGAGGIVV